MKEISLDDRIRFAIAKGRNIIYYKNIDDRPRAQYIHVLRQYRQELIDIINLFPDNYYEIKNNFLDVIKLIDPKITSEDCEEIIELMKTCRIFL